MVHIQSNCVRLQVGAAQQGAAYLGTAQQGAVKLCAATTVCSYIWLRLQVGAA